MRLLVAEAEPTLAEFLRTRLQQEQFVIKVIRSAKEIPEVAEGPPIDVVLLDMNLPGIAGLEILRSLQGHWPSAPIILLSGESTVEERVRGLEAGADDVIVKPFALPELVARIRAVTRRRNRLPLELFLYEDLEINRVSHHVSRAGRSIELSPKEYALLEFLLRNPGRPVSRAAIIEEVWRIHGDSITNVVDVYINYLRRKIDMGSERPLIRTVRGVGYQIGGNHNGVALTGAGAGAGMRA
jgi:DNA-binding response OmpR family regulator